MHNISHFEIPSTNLEKSGNFFRLLFGWKIDTFSDEYLICQLNDTDSGGIFLVDDIKPSQIAIYFQVANIPEILKKAESLGGKILEKKRSIGEHGFIAAFEDPCGGRIDIWAKE